MAIERVKKVQIVGFQELKKPVIEILQEKEILHIENISSKSFSWQEVSSLRRIERVFRAFEQLGERNFLGDIFPQRVFIDKDRFKKVDFKKAEGKLKEITDILKERDQLLLREESIRQKIVNLFTVEFLNISLKELTSLKKVELLFLKISPKEKSKLSRLKGVIREPITSLGKREIILLCARKEQKEEVIKILREEKLELLELPITIWKEFESCSPIEAKKLLEQKLSQIQSRIKELDKRLKTYLVYKEELMVLYDYLLNENFKDALAESFPKTKRLFILEGWVLEKEEKELFSSLNRFREKVYIRVREPFKEELPPTKLRNKPVFEPFQILVNMYGAPHPASLDPTVFLAPFFFFFVGICISDAGYGAILAGLSFYILKRKKLTYSGRIFFKLLSLLGLSTFLVGFLLGSFLGISLPFKGIDILSSPFQFLLFCFFLGFLQVLLGVVLKVYVEFKNKNYQRAISFLSWAGMLISLPFFFIFKIALFKFLSIGAALGILLFSSESKNILKRFAIGLYELYGITRYFSDILSYSRLLALGMATGVIAMVINLLAKSALSIPFVGFLIAGGIFLGGHIFNLSINLMGGFIHSARLQFVEFFSKFFILGRDFFQPLKIETKYTALLKEAEE